LKRSGSRIKALGQADVHLNFIVGIEKGLAVETEAT
jgi:hypothetical protein